MTLRCLTTRAALILIACAPAAACANGQPDQADKPGGRDMTLAQFEQRHEARMMAADSDGDGRISRAEFLAAQSGHGDAAARFARLDANGDGMLDRGEIDAMLARRFHRLDADGNGIVTAQERAAAHRQRGQDGTAAAPGPSAV